jgi:hypothetical protein
MTLTRNVSSLRQFFNEWNIPPLCEGITIPEESGAEAREEFEIGRILHLKSEITNF